jgi:ribosomal protein S18 acetylase RimI-like enzyme
VTTPTSPGTEILVRHALHLAVAIRACTEDDLPALEWFGVFTPHRQLIRDAYERQLLGEVVMLVAEMNGFPVGQAWIDFVRHAGDSVGGIWALRVLPPLQRTGIGTQLLSAAEMIIGARGRAAAEVGVEKDNSGARCLYERVGYRVVREEYEEYDFTTPDGAQMRVPVDQWILRKRLVGRDECRASDRDE